jgi:hypothetical protein
MPTPSRGHGTSCHPPKARSRAEWIHVVNYLVVNYLLKVVDHTTPPFSYFPLICAPDSAGPSDFSHFLNVALNQ